MEKKTIDKKLLEAQMKIASIKKGKVNPFFKSKYADINSYIEEVKPILNECGLIILQPLTIRDGKIALKTVIIDSDSKEEIKSVVPLPENPDPQKMGAVITYFRRYAIQSMLFLQATDDDGNFASEKSSSETEYKKVGDRVVDGNSEVPTCSVCGELMKKSKAGKFYCKHGNEWGKPVFPEKEVIVDSEENPF